MNREEYICNQMYKQHALLRKDSWTDADKLEYMELNIAPYSRYWRMGMKKALKHAIRLLREEEATADRKTEPTGSKMKPLEQTESRDLAQDLATGKESILSIAIKGKMERRGKQTDCPWK